MTGADTVIVIAKDPLPGRAKTRLRTRFDADQTAALARAALVDTLAAVRASTVPRRVLYWQDFGPDDTGYDDGRDGRPDERHRPAAGLDRGFEVVPQCPGDLAVRLAHAFTTVPRGPDDRCLLVGMDTPQLAPGLLGASWEGADAVLGLAEDGGFWAIGLRGDLDPDVVFEAIPMSTDRTGAAQLARLNDLGLEVRLLPPLRDVDTPDDAAAVARAHPELRFSRLHDQLVRDPAAADRTDVAGRSAAAGRSAGATFDAAYDGSALSARSDDDAALDPLRLDLPHWLGAADPVDALVITRCRPPVLDLGCGPGRLTVALTDLGVPSLGVDLSARAVARVRDHAAHSLQRDLFDRLPLEGTWGTVVLLDSNLGIGGDLGVLLARCVALAAPGGLVIVEVDPEVGACSAHQVELCSGGNRVVVPWGRYGATAVAAAARAADLVVAEEWSAAGRTFMSLGRL